MHLMLDGEAHRYYVLIGRYVMALIRASVDLVEHGPRHRLPLSLLKMDGCSSRL